LKDQDVDGRIILIFVMKQGTRAWSDSCGHVSVPIKGGGFIDELSDY
jgi:nitrite reductase/ring-hydroxylating ferredoxin subunit